MKMTLKTAPLNFGGGGSDYKVRLNEEVVDLIHASVTRRWNGADVGRRYAVEAVLRDWLSLNGESSLPTVLPPPPVPNGRIRHGVGGVEGREPTNMEKIAASREMVARAKWQ